MSPTALQFLLLEMLGEGEHYGITLARRSGGRISQRQIYPLLGRLVDLGYAERVREPVPPGSLAEPRFLYRRTLRGTELVRQRRRDPTHPNVQTDLDTLATLAEPADSHTAHFIAGALVFLLLLFWVFLR